MSKGPAFFVKSMIFHDFFPFFGGCMAAKLPIPMSPDPPTVKPQLLSFSRKKTANCYLLSVLNSRYYTHFIRNRWHGKNLKLYHLKIGIPHQLQFKANIENMEQLLAKYGHRQWDLWTIRMKKHFQWPIKSPRGRFQILDNLKKGLEGIFVSKLRADSCNSSFVFFLLQFQ